MDSDMHKLKLVDDVPLPPPSPSPSSESLSASRSSESATTPSRPTPSSSPEASLILEWDAWLARYSHGLLDLSSPAAPNEPQSVAEGSEGYFGAEGRELDAASSLDTYKNRGYLPATLGPAEGERRKVLERFKLADLQPGDPALALDRIAEIASIAFKVPIVVISVVLEDKEIFASTLGWDPNERAPGFKRIEIPLAAALCPHAMLHLDQATTGCFILPDTTQDACQGNGGGGPITFFASSNIYLEANYPPGVTPDGRPPDRLPVGSICLVDLVSRPFSQDDELVLKGLSDLISRQIEHSFDQKRHRSQEAQAQCVEDFVRRSLVNQGETEADVSSIDDAVQDILSLTLASSVAFIDLRNFESPLATARQNPASPELPSHSSRPSIVREASYTSSTMTSSSNTPSHNAFTGREVGTGKLGVLAEAGEYEWRDAVQRPGAASAVSHALVAFDNDGFCQFDTGTAPSPLIDLLPPDTAASLNVPIYDFNGRPAFMIVVSSAQRHFRFEAMDLKFVETIGAVVVASLLRARILEADRAKLSFVSQVTHELLTPLHGVRGQIDLIRSTVPGRTGLTIKPLLDLADVCLGSLSEILSDTLEFTKLSKAGATLQKPTYIETDLETTLEEVVKVCWARRKQQDSVTGVTKDGVPPVKILMDYRLPPDQLYHVDVGGLKRLFMNLVGNALKFTTSGHVKIIAQEQERISASTRTISISVLDTGVGMSEAFMSSGLFVPFKQMDSFAQGAGLGVSICQHIVKRMEGTLRYESSVGVGTLATVTLPLELVAGSNTSSAPRPKTPSRIISDEIVQLLDPLNYLGDIAAESSDGIESRPITPLTNGVRSASIAEPDQLRPRVLVVDDNFIARKLLTTYLTKQNVVYEAAVDGEDAVEKFESFRPNMIWIDIQMPKLGGIDASRRIRELEAAHDLEPACIIALSGLSSDLPEHAAALANGQIDQWLVKGGPSLRSLGLSLVQLEEKLAVKRAKVAELEATIRGLKSGRRS